MNKLLPILLLILAGCKTQQLPENWKPLTTVVERTLDSFGGTYTTVSPYLFTKDLDNFNEKSELDMEALRRHEVIHAENQEAFIDSRTGLKRHAVMSQWLRKYLTDKAFRWEIEKAGYKAEILYRRSRGQRIIAEIYARILSGKTYMWMVTYNEALEWVQDVIWGRQ